MTETPEQRARRLGLTSGGEDPALARAKRPGLDDAAPRESVRLDVRSPSESTRALPFNRQNPRGDFQALEGAPSALVEPLAASALVAAQAVPGMETFQSAAGSLGSKFTDKPLSFRESRDALRSQTDYIPTPIKIALQAPALLKTAASLALSPAKAGGLFGAADQALSPSDMSVGERAGRTVAGGVGGAAVGKSLDALITGGRAMLSKSPGANTMARVENMRKADAPAFAAAAAEGTAAGGTTPEIVAALKNKTVAPYAKMIRSSEEFAGADDATVLRETYKLMSREQGGLRQQIADKGFDAKLDLKLNNLTRSKRSMMGAADEPMPSLRPANVAHAARRGEIEAVELGAEGARRTVGAPPIGKNIETKSKEAYVAEIRKRAANEKAAAIEGALGDLRERIGVAPNLVSAGGLLTSAIRPAKVAGFLRQVGDPKQQTLDKIVRGGFLGATTLEELLRNP